MNSLKVLCFAKNYRLINSLKRDSKLIQTNIKSFSLTPNHSKDVKKSELKTQIERQVNELQNRFKLLIGEQSSALKPLLQRMINKSWLEFVGQPSKSIQIKERKHIKSLREGMFRTAYDLKGFKPEDIQIIVSNDRLYIEAIKGETTKDGMKSWRELSFECNIDQNLNPDSISAQLDSDGLLVIDAEVPKDSLSGVKRDGKQ